MKFTPEEGFFVAAAITAYDSVEESIEIPDKYGELVIEHYGWGNEGVTSSFDRLQYHQCSDEELGIERGPNTLVYPVFQNDLEQVKVWRKKFKCIEPKDLVIWGNYNSVKAQ